MPRERAPLPSSALVCRQGSGPGSGLGSEVDGCMERAPAPEPGPRWPWLDVPWAPSPRFSFFPGARRVLVP